MSTIALSYANANISLTNSENASIAGGLVGVVSQGSVSISASYFKGNSPGGEIIGAIQGDATVDARCLYHQTDNIIAVESDKLTLNQNCIISATEVPFEYNAKNLATASTTMQELGLTANETIELVSNGTLYTYTVETTTTIGDMLSYLNEKGFNATLDNGILNIEGTEEAWINVDFNNNLDSIFNFEDRRDSYIDVGGNIHLALNGGVKKTLVSTKEIQNVTMDETTTMKDLGISSGTIIIKNTDGSEVASYTYNSSTTMDDYMQFLNDQYFQTGIVDGKLDISSPGDIYVVDENLSNKLNITDSMCIVNYPTASYNTYYTGATLASTTPICVTTGGNVVTKTVAVSLTSTSDIAIHKSTDSFISF